MFYHICDPPNSHPLEWDQEKILSDEYENCPANPGHPKMGRTRANDLHVILPSSRVLDIMITWHGEIVITDHTAELLDENHLTGFELKPLIVTKIKRGDKDITKLPKLWELKVTGWGGLAPKESGIELNYRCSDCGMSRYSGLCHSDKLIDITQWDGSDFIIVWPLPRFAFVTEKCKQIMEKNRLKGLIYIPYTELTIGKDGFGPAPLWHHLGKERAEKLGGPLGIT